MRVPRVVTSTAIAALFFIVIYSIFTSSSGGTPTVKVRTGSGKSVLSTLQPEGTNAADTDARQAPLVSAADAATIAAAVHAAAVASVPVPLQGVEAIKNETLGFGEIILLSLKSRTDRRDAVALMCSLTDIKISRTIDGVQTQDIARKAYPNGPGLKKLLTDKYKPYVGSWRSHMDVLRYIVDNRIETALILEDDVDWDVHLRDQMTAFANGLRSSPSAKLRKPFSADELERAPYGLDWDIIHFAASKVVPPPAPFNTLAKYSDVYRQSTETANNACFAGWFCWREQMKKAGLTEQERYISPSYDTVGLAAIAVSFRGAQRLLYFLSYKELTDTLDNSVSALLQQGYVHGWSVVPPLMAEWKINSITDSDLNTIDLGQIGGPDNSKGKSAGIANSVRKHLSKEFEPQTYWDARKQELEAAKPQAPDRPAEELQGPGTEVEENGKEERKTERKTEAKENESSKQSLTPPPSPPPQEQSPPVKQPATTPA
ncbi:uncharacterized protein V1518DRAFT_422968 [Limtongia smithiae]|uniref:uncharacterized protein n=1 Tax=Limtongia smithiae TaxID=1125753 RepID=UPI0034CD5859